MNSKKENIKELEQKAQDIRDRIIEVVSVNGGHFSSTLGAVELTLGMHEVFDCEFDPFIFDVSHQCYPHKLITGRWEEFNTLRQFKGMSGFTKPKESDADYICGWSLIYFYLTCSWCCKSRDAGKKWKSSCCDDR